MRVELINVPINNSSYTNDSPKFVVDISDFSYRTTAMINLELEPNERINKFCDDIVKEIIPLLKLKIKQELGKIK